MQFTQLTVDSNYFCVVTSERQAIPGSRLHWRRKKENPTWLHQGLGQTGCTTATHCVRTVTSQCEI